jgi:hypothetical protein
MVPKEIDVLLNNTFSPPETEYNVIVGNDGNLSIPMQFILGYPNDCVVTVESARGLNFPTLELTDVIHASVFLFGCWGRAHYFTHIKTNNAVIDVVFEGIGDFTTEDPSAHFVPGSANDDFLNEASIITFGSKTAAGVEDYPVIVEPALPSLSFALFWLASETFTPTLQLTVETPDGQIITDTLPGVEHDTAVGPGLGELLFDLYSVDNPAMGEWVLHVAGNSVPDEVTPYAVMVLPDSPTSFTADLDDVFYLEGEAVLLTTSLEENGIPLSDTAAIATATLPDGGQTTLILHDDGLNGDEVAGDGVHSLRFTTGACGHYLFEINGTGTSSLGPVAREQLVYASVYKPGESLAGWCPVEGVYLPAVVRNGS